MSCEEELDEKLIDCVRSFPGIYDPSKKSYKDRTDKDNSWKCIATALDRDGKVVTFTFLLPSFCNVSKTFQNNIKYFLVVIFL